MRQRMITHKHTTLPKHRMEQYDLCRIRRTTVGMQLSDQLKSSRLQYYNIRNETSMHHSSTAIAAPHRSSITIYKLEQAFHNPHEAVAFHPATLHVQPSMITCFMILLPTMLVPVLLRYKLHSFISESVSPV